MEDYTGVDIIIPSDRGVTHLQFQFRRRGFRQSHPFQRSQGHGLYSVVGLFTGSF